MLDIYYIYIIDIRYMLDIYYIYIYIIDIRYMLDIYIYYWYKIYVRYIYIYYWYKIYVRYIYYIYIYYLYKIYVRYYIYTYNIILCYVISCSTWPLSGSVQLQRGEAKPKGCTEAPKGGSVNFALDALRAQLCYAKLWKTIGKWWFNGI